MPKLLHSNTTPTIIDPVIFFCQIHEIPDNFIDILKIIFSSDHKLIWIFRIISFAVIITFRFKFLKPFRIFLFFRSSNSAIMLLFLSKQNISSPFPIMDKNGIKSVKPSSCSSFIRHSFCIVIY